MKLNKKQIDEAQKIQAQFDKDMDERDALFERANVMAAKLGWEVGCNADVYYSVPTLDGRNCNVGEITQAILLKMNPDTCLVEFSDGWHHSLEIVNTKELQDIVNLRMNTKF